METVKRGTIISSKETIKIPVKCSVAAKMYTKNQKKYIDLELPTNVAKKVNDVHKSFASHMTKNNVINPLEGTTLKVKIPFIHNRVSCKINGTKTLQEYKVDDPFEGTITYCGIWSVGDYCGPSWKLVSVE